MHAVTPNCHLCLEIEIRVSLSFGVWCARYVIPSRKRSSTLTPTRMRTYARTHRQKGVGWRYRRSSAICNQLSKSVRELHLSFSYLSNLRAYLVHTCPSRHWKTAVLLSCRRHVVHPRAPQILLVCIIISLSAGRNQV